VKITAIVPMRHSSERVPGKNYRLLGDRPLYRHIVQTLLNVPEINEVVIDTDSPTILQDAADAFPTVRLLERPEHLRAGATPMNDVLVNTVAQVNADLFLQTHSTNPFLTAATISSGLQQLAQHDEADSLFSVTRLQARLWDKDIKPLNHDPAVLLRTQDLDPVYLENSCMYVFDRQTLVSRGNRIGQRPLVVEVDGHEALDIDEERDFRAATLLWNSMMAGA
jgi:CMP-N-acetylneuraminic acid synthetase